jgi:hypothetical protein
LNNNNHAFIQLLTEAYEKGEQEPGMTVEKLVKELSYKLKSIVEGTGSKITIDRCLVGKNEINRIKD